MSKNVNNPRTRIGPIRLGIQYQDAVALSLLVDWLGNRERYVRLRFEASEDNGSLDDIIGERRDGTVDLRQVKYAVDGDSQDSEWGWDALLKVPKHAKSSLLGRWNKSYHEVVASGQSVQVEIITNRGSAPDLSPNLRSGEVDFDSITDLQVRSTIIEQTGSEATARGFFQHCRFRFSEPSLKELYEGARRRFHALNGEQDGWNNLEHEVARWAIEKTDEWRPDGYITIGALLHAARWNRLRPLSQDVEVPLDFQLPDSVFHSALVSELSDDPKPCTVIVGPPGVGKSTYASHLFEELVHLGVPVIRHHYHLSFAKRDAARLDHRIAAESLLHDLRADFMDSLGALQTHNPTPDALREHLVAAGTFFAKDSKALVVLLDGLDHVWRENDSIEELRRLVEMLLPLPTGVALLIATQPVSDDKLPNNLLQVAPRSQWRSLPRLGVSAVATWLKHHWPEISPNPSAQAVDYFFEQAVQRLHERSGGHPLHLRYTVEALKARGQPATTDNIDALPACPHADITNYYAELWRAIEDPAKLSLQLLTACAFPWPSDGLDTVLLRLGVSLADAQRSRRSVEHLLAQTSLGLQPFHRSLAIWIEDQPDFSCVVTRLRESAAEWLSSGAPESLRWAHLWSLQADLGNIEPLVNGLSRSWAVDAIAKRRSWRRIRELLERGARDAFLHRRYARATAIGLVAEYFEYYTDANFGWEELVPAQLSCPLDPKLAARLRLEVDELLDKEIAWLAEEADTRGDHKTVAQCFTTLERRFHEALQIRDRQRQESSRGDPVHAMRVSVLLNDEDSFKRTLRLLEANLQHPSAPAWVQAMFDQCWRSRLVSRARSIMAFLAATDREPPANLLSLASSSAFVLATEENADLTTEFGAARFSRCREAALHSQFHGKPVSVDPEPPSVTAFRGRMDLTARRTGGRRLCVEAFRYFLANHFLQRPEKNQLWLDSFPPREWLPDFLLQLDRTAAALAVQIPVGKVPGVGWLFQQFASIRSPREFGPKVDEGHDFALAGSDALTDIGFELLSWARGRGLPARIEREDLEALADSGFWFSGLWLNALADERRAWLSTSALASLIERESHLLQAKVEEFNSRADTCRALATVCAWHSDSHNAHDFTRFAADNYLTHTNHKDVLLFHALGAIEKFIHGGGVCDADVRSWLRQLAVPIEHVRDFTDGDETRHLPGKLAQVIIEVAPDLFRPYYQHLCNDESYWEATEAFNAFLEQVDLSKTDNQSLAQTALDRDALKILDRRAAAGDAGAIRVKTALLREMGDGAFDNLEDERTSSNLPQQAAFKPLPAPEKFPPAKLDEYCDTGRASGELEDRLLERWLAYWKLRASPADLFEALRRRSENSANYFSHHDELYDAARLHFGNAGAFQWLIAAQSADHGWQTRWGRGDASNRFEQVRLHYPERWEEFLRESVLKTWKEFKRGGVIGNGNWPRLIEFLMVVGQHSLARSLVEQSVVSALEMVSPQRFAPPAWTLQKSPGDE